MINQHFWREESAVCLLVVVGLRQEQCATQNIPVNSSAENFMMIMVQTECALLFQCMLVTNSGLELGFVLICFMKHCCDPSQEGLVM